MPPKKNKGNKSGKSKPTTQKTPDPIDYQAIRDQRLHEIHTAHLHRFNLEHIACPIDVDTYDEPFCHIETDPVKGRVLIADMDFSPGDVIFREKPFAVASWNDFQCFDCLRPHKPEKCAKMKAIYPPQLGQQLTRLEDLLTGFETVGDLDRARLFLKILYIYQLAPDSPSIEALRSLTFVDHHYDLCLKMVNDIRQRKACIASGLFPSTISSEDIARILAILNNNSHEIEGIGSGIFLFASMLEHACTPNANFVTQKDELILIAIQPIAKGQSLSIDYNSTPYKPTAHRQRVYENRYGFKCTCQSCTTDRDYSRTFYCPRSIRYHAIKAMQSNQNGFLIGTYLVSLSSNDQQHPNGLQIRESSSFASYRGDDDYTPVDLTSSSTTVALSGDDALYQSQRDNYKYSYTHTNSRIMIQNNTFYSQNNMMLITPNAPAENDMKNPCQSGIVVPCGTGEDITTWTCLTCQYQLTPEEVQLCLHFESLVPPPPESTGETKEDRDMMFDLEHSYTAPSLATVNQAISAGVIHWSHSSIFWTLYLLALDHAKEATDAYMAVSSELRRQQRKLRKGKRSHHHNNQQQKLQVDTINEEEQQQIDFWNLEFTMDAYQQQLPKHKILALLTEHLWKRIIDAANIGLQTYHPDKLIYYDYLAQIYVLMGDVQRAQRTWVYCYQLSVMMNSKFTLETLKIRRLATKPPKTLQALQFHYTSMTDLLEEITYNEDVDGARLLHLFAQSSLDEEEGDGNILGMKELKQLMRQDEFNFENESDDGDDDSDSNDDDNDDDDMMGLLANSAFAQGIQKNAQELSKQQRENQRKLKNEDSSAFFESSLDKRQHQQHQQQQSMSTPLSPAIRHLTMNATASASTTSPSMPTPFGVPISSATASTPFIGFNSINFNVSSSSTTSSSAPFSVPMTTFGGFNATKQASIVDLNPSTSASPKLTFGAFSHVNQQ